MKWAEFVTDDHSRPDTGRLALFLIMWVVLGAIPWMLIIATYSVGADPSHHFDPQPLGIAIGAVCTGFGAALGALGIYISQDKKPSAPPPVGVANDSQSAQASGL